MADLLPRPKFFTEHLVFIALLIPTFLVLAAAVVSLAQPDPSVVVQPRPAMTATACEACYAYDEVDDQP